MNICSKLQWLSLPSLLVKPEPITEEYLSDTLILGRLLSLSANIKLSRVGLTLAYCKHAWIMDENFINICTCRVVAKALISGGYAACDVCLVLLNRVLCRSSSSAGVECISRCSEAFSPKRPKMNAHRVC